MAHAQEGEVLWGGSKILQKSYKKSLFISKSLGNIAEDKFSEHIKNLNMFKRMEKPKPLQFHCLNDFDLRKSKQPKTKMLLRPTLKLGKFF